MHTILRLSTGRRRRQLAVLTGAAVVAALGMWAPVTSSVASPASVAGVASPAAVPLAFPGAEGAGAYAKGGRGGDVYYVTNLADSGPGSLRNGVDTAPATGRTILFKVSGIIALQSGLSINKSNITIAGQTAPGDGIMIRNYTIYVGEPPPRKPGSSLANDVVIRHIRLGLGVGTQGPDQLDNIWVNSGSNIIIDHVSSSWSADEVLSASRDVKNLTVQNTLMYEALNAEGHGFGSIIDSGYDTAYSYHHNLWAHNASRNPRPGTSDPDPGFKIDFRNNVYDWGYRVGYSASDDKNIQLNYVNNYLIAGPSSTENCAMEGGDSSEKIYQSGNKIDLNKNGRVDGADTGWGMFCGSYQKQSTPHVVPPVQTDSAESAYLKVLAQGGAMPWRRDSTDRRLVGTVRTQTGKVINSQDEVGGYPTLNSEPAPTDTDNDGMPDYWEQAMGLNPNNEADRNNTDSAGYTMLENYLNWLADGHAVAERNTPVDVDLQTLNGGVGNLRFAVASAGNGTATLLGDGHTVRFNPAADHVGSANFSYRVTDPETGFGFGPVNVGVLVKGKANAPVAPSITAQPTDQTVTVGGSAAFSVAAVGTAPLSYQWRFDGVAIPGANGPGYTVTDVRQAQAGRYTVVVSNAAGSVTSDPATLTVLPADGGSTTTYEAEAGTSSGGTKTESNHPGYTGTGFVNFPSSGGALQFDNVSGGAGGNATLTIRFANGSGKARTGRLVVNGTGRNLTTPVTSSWDDWQVLPVTVPLVAGSGNTIRFETTGQDLANLDHVVVVTSGG